MDLVELLKRPEGKTLEFKRDLSTPQGALKTIVAIGKINSVLHGLEADIKAGASTMYLERAKGE